MERPNPYPSLSSPLRFRTSPSEQDVFADSQLFRAMANTQGHTAHVKPQLWGTMFPLAEDADLRQMLYLGLRRST